MMASSERDDSPSDEPTDAEILAAKRYAAEGYEPGPYVATGYGERPRGRRLGGGLDLATLADDFLDELMPEEIDWRRLVSTYPKTFLSLAAIGGYLLGRSQGRRLVHRASGLVMGEMRRVVQETVGDLFEELPE